MTLLLVRRLRGRSPPQWRSPSGQALSTKSLVRAVPAGTRRRIDHPRGQRRKFQRIPAACAVGVPKGLFALPARCCCDELGKHTSENAEAGDDEERVDQNLELGVGCFLEEAEADMGAQHRRN